MVAPVGGGGNAAAAAAAAAARAAAEAARRAAAEAARRAAAEAARRAAEAAQRAAEQAAQRAADQAAKAAAAKQAAEAAKSAAKQSVEQVKSTDKKDPGALAKAQADAQKATKEAAARTKQAAQAEAQAQQAQQAARQAAEAARASTSKANEAARADGKPEPFPPGQQRTGFEPGHNDANTRLGGDAALTKDELKGHLDANQDFARLAQKPETRQALTKLGIKDGAGLKDFGSQLGRAADSDAAQKASDPMLADARKSLDAKALSEVIQSSAKAADVKSLTDPKLADAIAGGKNPREAVLAQKAQELPPETKQGLEKLGVKPEEYAGASKKAQEQLDAASKAVVNNKPEQALTALQGAAAEGSRALAEKGLKALAEQQEGPGKALLSNPEVSKRILDNKDTAAAVGQVLGGEPQAKLEGLKTLAKDDALRGPVLQAAAKDPNVQKTLQQVGLEGKDLEKLGKAAGDVLSAASDLAKDPAKALSSLNDAFKANADLLKGDLGKKVFDKVAGALTGPAKELLADPKVREQVLAAGSSALDALGKLAKGGEGVLSGLTDLAKNDKLRDAVSKVAGKAEGVKEALEKVGLKPADLLNAKDMLPSMLEAGQKALNKDFSGALDSVRDALKKGGPLSEKMLKGLADNLPDGMGLGKKILQDPGVIKELINNDAAFASAKNLFQPGKELDGVSGLLANDSLRNSVIDAAVKDPSVQTQMQKMGLDANMLKQAGAAAPHLLEAGRALLSDPKDWKKGLSELGQAAGAAPDVLNKMGQEIYKSLPPGVQKNLSDMGITAEHLKEAGAALPHLVNAGQALADGKPEDALKEMGQALQGSPEIVSTMLNKASEKLKPGLMKDLLSDKNLVKELVTNKDLHASIGKILSGSPEGIKEGLRGISANAPAMKAVADSLWNNKDLREKFQKVGFESAADLADAGSALDDVMALKDAITKPGGPDVKAAFDAGLNVLNDLPEGLKNKIGDKLTKTLKLPPGLSDMVIGGAEALKDPAVRANLSNAVDAFSKHDVSGFIDALGATGQSIADKHPDLATGFLDMMGKLPGSVGRFFSDHSVNEGLVKSGAMSEVFQATQKLAHGDITGALTDVMEAGGKAMGYGEHYKLEVPFWPHKPSVTLPFGEEGMKLMGGLAKQFVSALPESVRTKIETKIAETVAKAGGSAIPGGGIISAIGDGKDLIDELGKDEKNWVSIGLKGAEVALDVAGTFPGLGAITGPLRGVVGTIDVLHDASNMISDVKSFGDEFAFGTA